MAVEIKKEAVEFSMNDLQSVPEGNKRAMAPPQAMEKDDIRSARLKRTETVKEILRRRRLADPDPGLP